MSLSQSPTLLVLGSAVTFLLVGRLLRAIPMPKLVAKDRTRTWRWRNLSVSIVHSLVMGTSAVLCVFLYPDILTDMYDYSPQPAYLLLCASLEDAPLKSTALQCINNPQTSYFLSVIDFMLVFGIVNCSDAYWLGYFYMDAADIILSGQASASWEFLFHHALVISCFTYAAFTGLYVAGTTVALFVEVNSIFLHTRLLLKLCNAQDSALYRVNRYLNILTFVSFRLGAHFFITWFLLSNLWILPKATFYFGAMTTINIVILIYFYRLIRADFFPRSRFQGNTMRSYDENKFLND